ncbi:MAG TPA: AAA family ATPase [Steroidobacteraceae bacterium]|nr:AAA family ATPase [Steroidobacteraceae bacterium]
MSIIEAALSRLRQRALGTGGPPTWLRPVPSWAGAQEPDPSRREITFDRGRLRAAGYLPEEALEEQFQDYYREIKRHVIRRALAPDVPADRRLILVTSALPGEGKTFTAVNLALSLARERDVSVLLVDADFPKSHVGEALGVHEEPGLLEAIEDEALDVESLVLRTSIKGLEILPAGRAASGAVELVTSVRMAEIAARLLARNPRRLVVLDSAPLLASSVARALLELPGQIILVARAGQTPRLALQDAIAHIEKKKLTGLVLNDAYLTSHAGYYGYGGSYGYGGDHSGEPAPGASGGPAGEP